MLLFLPPRARESVLMLTWDVGTGMDGVQARAFPLFTGAQDFWQLFMV